MSLTKYKKRHYGSENYIYSLQTIHVLILQYDSTNHNSIRNNFICVGPVNGDAIAINDNISVWWVGGTRPSSVQLTHC